LAFVSLVSLTVSPGTVLEALKFGFLCVFWSSATFFKFFVISDPRFISANRASGLGAFVVEELTFESPASKSPKLGTGGGGGGGGKPGPEEVASIGFGAGVGFD
jgi:hypothetical protein